MNHTTSVENRIPISEDNEVLSMDRVEIDIYNEWINNNCPIDTKIKEISIKDKKYLKELYKLPNLQKLYCCDNQITSLQGLEKCVNLQELCCNFNQLTSLQGLENCENLQALYCWENQLTSLQGLENCRKLQELYCWDNQLTSLQELKNCENLQKFTCNNNQLTSLQELENCVKLQELYCWENQLTSLQGLENCENLQELFCNYNQLTSLQGLENCENLHKITCYNNQLTSFQGLEKCENLHYLNCNGNQLTSLQGLEKCENLHFLNCNGNQLTSLQELENCVNLQELQCWENQLTSLRGLENCVDLQELYCWDNQLTSLQGLENCRNLQYLNHANNEIIYIPPYLERILNRNIQGIYNDSQNVHNSNIQECIRKSIYNIINIQPKNTELLALIIEDDIFDENTKNILVEYIEDKNVHSILNVTFGEILLHVLNRLNDLPNKDEIKKVLCKEMNDSVCKCFTGRISRLINCLNGFDELVKIQIADVEQIGFVISNIKEKLERDNKYTIEDHKEMVTNELTERGYSSKIIKEWADYIE